MSFSASAKMAYSTTAQIRPVNLASLNTESPFPNFDEMTGSRPNPKKNPVYPYKDCLIANCSLTKLSYQSMINISQRRRVLGYYKRGDLEITSITVQQFRHRWG